MPKINVGDVNLNVVERGSGEPLLLVHGFPLNHEMWDKQLDGLSDEFRVIAPDLRGFGRSDVTEGTVTMDQFADDLHAMLNALGLSGPIHFCGLSMGGYIAWAFLRKYGDRLGSLILCDTRAAADTPEGVTNRHKLAESVLEHGSEFAAKAMVPNLFALSTVEEHPEIVKGVEGMMLATDPRGIAAASRGMAARTDSTQLLPDIAVPTLIIVGEHDKITTAAEMRQITAAIPGAQIAEIADAGHMSPLEKPETVNETVRQFLRAL